jgi:hypothetical protein
VWHCAKLKFKAKILHCIEKLDRKKLHFSIVGNILKISVRWFYY